MSSSQTQLQNPKLYQIGWITALPVELAAAKGMLEEQHKKPVEFKKHPTDDNQYTWGAIREHRVVIASLPKGRYGNVSAATTALHMRASLPHLKFCLLVGIGAGVPDPENGKDVRLGDVVVSLPNGTSPGVVQYDFGKIRPNGRYERAGTLASPPTTLLNGIGNLESEHMMQGGNRIPQLLEDMFRRYPSMKRSERQGMAAFDHPGSHHDQLFKASSLHVTTRLDCPTNSKDATSCKACDQHCKIKRNERTSTKPQIHYGTIATGNSVVKDGISRDDIVRRLDCDCLCFEMEAAGLMNTFPCLVVRGVCDYADTHKNDIWHPYAAAVAAAYGRELLEVLDNDDVDREPTMEQVAQQIDKGFHGVQQSLEAIQRTVENPHAECILEQLPYARSVTFDSAEEASNSTCLEHTRVEVLDHIESWTVAKTGKTIYWLNGVAGTGKSTIARTIAKRMQDRHRLGASFFFRNDQDSQRTAALFVPTIAYQLAHKITVMHTSILEAFKVQKDVLGSSLVTQFQVLLASPLESISKRQQHQPLLVVIDALDECRNVQDVQAIIGLIAQLQTRGTIRFLITSRPDLPIPFEFSQIARDCERWDLQDKSDNAIQRDILHYIKTEFGTQQAKVSRQWDLGRAENNWPDKESLERLAALASPLFIVASTVCRYIWDAHSEPKSRLDHFLNEPRYQNMTQFERTYLPALEKLLDGVPKADKKQKLANFRKTVGSILCLFEPKSKKFLEQIGLGEGVPLLDYLGAFLEVSKDEHAPIRAFHLSFSDFLLVEAECQVEHPYQIFKQSAHKQIWVSCLHFLCTPGVLHKNMCAVSRPDADCRSVLDNITRNISPEVSYACRFWTVHLRECGIFVDGLHHVMKFLTTHFLHWIETMTWLGHLSHCVTEVEAMIALTSVSPSVADQMQSLAKDIDSPTLEEFSVFLGDAREFLKDFATGIHQAPLQIYRLATVFNPKNSKIEVGNDHECPSWLEANIKTARQWSQQGPSFELAEPTGKLIFSPDGKTIATTTYEYPRRILIWSACDATLRQTLHIRTTCLKELVLVFSPDSTHIACASREPVLTLMWDIVNLTRETRMVTGSPVAFSGNSSLLATRSHDGSVDIWSVRSVQKVKTIDTRSAKVLRMIFSPDSGSLITVSDDKYIRFWSTDNWTMTDIFDIQFSGQRPPLHRCRWMYPSTMADGDEAHGLSEPYIGNLAVNASHLAWRLNVKYLAVWDFNLSRITYHLESPGAAADCEIVISLDGQNLALSSKSAPKDRRDLHRGHVIHVWSLRDGQKILAFQRRGCIISFLSDGRTLLTCTATNDATNDYYCWDAITGDMADWDLAHSNSNYAAFSALGNTLALVGGRTVTLLDVSRSCSVPRHRHNLHPSISPNGQITLIHKSDERFELRSTDGEFLGVFDGLEQAVFSPDGKLLACCQNDKGYVMDISSLQVIKKFPAPVLKLVFAPGSRRIAVFSNAILPLPRTLITVWDLDRERKVFQVSQRGRSGIGFLPVVAFSHDGGLLAVSGRRPCVWKVSTGKKEISLPNDDDSSSLLFSLDSLLLLSVQCDRKTIRVHGLSSPAIDVKLKWKESYDVPSFPTPHHCLLDVGGRTVHYSELCNIKNHEWKTRDCRLYVEGQWLCYRRRREIWLPYEYRGNVAYSKTGWIVIGQNDGKSTVYGVKGTRKGNRSLADNSQSHSQDDVLNKSDITGTVRPTAKRNERP